MNPMNNSACRYLFRSEAQEIFRNYQADKVEEFLSTMMRVNHHLLSAKKAYFLSDPMAYNDQCHLYALKTAKLMNQYAALTEAERTARTEDNRFLHLAFFLNYAVFSDTRKAVALFKKSMQELNIRPSQPKVFNQFLLDQGSHREKAARKALNGYFMSDIKKSVAGHPELELLASEDLFIPCSQGGKSGHLYTFPKFAGVAYFVDAIAQGQIPLVVKVKVFTRNGSSQEILVSSSRPISDDEPAIVVEAFASVDGMTVPGIREQALKCPQYFRASLNPSERHQTAKCFFCNEIAMDLAPFRERLGEVMKNPDDMLYAMGADFNRQIQKHFLHFFQGNQKYPELSKRFENAVERIQELGLDMNDPRSFSISHVYADIGSYAKTGAFQFQMTREAFLKSRGLL